tara:strand:- start:14488 stop:14931 length:444 start_codon:yes stop_codon:yes gene_type:complete
MAKKAVSKKAESAPLKGGVELFDVKSTSDAGIKVKLFTPNGDETEHWLTVLGADSDVFAQAESDALKKQIEATRRLEASPKLLADANRKISRDMVAKLVRSWSLTETAGECNTENVSKFFTKAPQIYEQVNSVAGNRKNFFTTPSMD